MLSRTLGLAAVVLLAGGLTLPVAAQNLEAGKTPSQLFAATCSLCHKSSRGLLKTVAPGSLPGFLRQHYTTSSDMASALSAYLLSNGATDTRIGGDNLTREGREARTAPKPNEAEGAGKPGQKQKPGARQREASRPDAEGAEPAKPAEKPPEGAEHPAPKEGDAAAPADARQKDKKLKQDKRKPKTATGKDESKPPLAAQETKPDEPKPTDAARSDRLPTTRPDPVPAVTPAPKPDTEPDAGPKTAEGKTPGSGMPVFNVEPPAPEAPAAPPEPPRAPAGPPVVPISQ